MRSVPVLATTVIIAAAAMTAACGTQHAGSSRSTAPGGAVSPTCTQAAPSSPQNPVITLSARDNGKSYCIKKGTGVLIYLKGSQALPWSHPTSHSTAMVPRANGHMMLMLGVTGGYFVADHQGVAVITATRSPCGARVAPTGPTTSHKMLCADIQTFRVTVTVVG